MEVLLRVRRSTALVMLVLLVILVITTATTVLTTVLLTTVLLIAMPPLEPRVLRLVAVEPLLLAPAVEPVRWTSIVHAVVVLHHSRPRTVRMLSAKPKLTTVAHSATHPTETHLLTHSLDSLHPNRALAVVPNRL
jgi:hypothetical protein